MSVITEVRKDREDLARVLKKHIGIRKIVEDLYPDSAHFIYELLQNAEDVDADEVSFILSKDCLIFEHNGKPFDVKDIYAITDIGDGTKSSDIDRIGKFGIGFKAVFAYTETPIIYSPTFSFQIDELVLPQEINYDGQYNFKTRFIFPFNNVKKSASNAHIEILSGLDDLSPKTLLFLKSIHTINFYEQDFISGSLTRTQHSNNHIEILKIINDKQPSHYHYLRFTENIPGLNRQFVAIAYELELNKNFTEYHPELPLADQFKIKNATPGIVAISFAADKEISGFRFHIHAPFIPELSRASVKDTTANDPLIQQLSNLANKSLISIRDLGLLTIDFLGVLPNKYDTINKKYTAIEKNIVYAMQNEYLTPTHDNAHYPSNNLIHSKSLFKSLLCDEDLEIIIDYDDLPYKWLANISQKNSNADRFLQSINIKNFDIENIIDTLKHISTSTNFYHKKLSKWILSKNSDWHQKLYAILETELDKNSFYKVKSLPIIRLSNFKYSDALLCYFPNSLTNKTSFAKFVDENTYSSGTNISEQTQAKNFLIRLGVKEIGQFEIISDVLVQNYIEATKSNSINFDAHLDDINQFIEFIENNPSRCNMFNNTYILFDNNNSLQRPSTIILDTPFSSTSLRYFYANKISSHSLFDISLKYINPKIDKNKFINFCKKIGVIHELQATTTTTYDSPYKSILHTHYNERWSGKLINVDWTIPNLEEALTNPSLELSRLIWRTMHRLSPEVLEAKFRPSTRYQLMTSHSQLVHILDHASWVPQENGQFVRPCDAIRDALPSDFAYASGWQWLKAIRFAENSRLRSEEYKRKISIAKELGFEDNSSLEDAKWFASLTYEERTIFKNIYVEKHNTELPTKQSKHPDRRALLVEEDAANAPARESEDKTRSITTSLHKVKAQTHQYLINEYTNNDGIMICQICKHVLPFKLSNEKYYFEAVEFIINLDRHYYQNYLSLCPNHAAMFKFANDPNNDFISLINNSTNNNISINLANKTANIYFSGNHLLDIKSILKTITNINKH